jgi:hypothetical protein
MTSENSRNVPVLDFNGTIIHDRAEMLCLTDMWRAAGSDPQQTPAKWRALPNTIDFIEHAALTIGKSDSDLFATQMGGRQPGTWAHWQIGLAYAKYLSHEFHMWCNTVVRERMEGKSVSLSIDPTTMEMIRRTDGIARQLSGKIAEIEKLLDRLEAAKVSPTFDYAGSVTSDQIIELAGIERARRVRGRDQGRDH